MSEVKFDEKAAALEGYERINVKVTNQVVQSGWAWRARQINCFLKGARWQFEQDKAAIEGKDREIERLRKACADYVTYFEESQFCKLNCDPSSNFHEPECSFVANINKALGVQGEKCDRCEDWKRMALSETCPSCDMAKEMQDGKG